MYILVEVGIHDCIEEDTYSIFKKTIEHKIGLESLSVFFIGISGAGKSFTFYTNPYDGGLLKFTIDKIVSSHTITEIEVSEWHNGHAYTLMPGEDRKEWRDHKKVNMTKVAYDSDSQGKVLEKIMDSL